MEENELVEDKSARMGVTLVFIAFIMLTYTLINTVVELRDKISDLQVQVQAQKQVKP